MTQPGRMTRLINAQEAAPHGLDSCRTAGVCCTVPGYALRDWRQPRPRGFRRIVRKNNNSLVNTDG
jgi:hypothetical protein